MLIFTCVKKENSRQSFDTVYHLTGVDKLDSISKHGLRPYSKRDGIGAIYGADKVIDSVRPSHIVRAGITRRKAVYAHPSQELHLDSMGALAAVQDDRPPIALSVNVDPSKVYVTNADRFGDVAVALMWQNRQGRSKQSKDHVNQAAEAYWRGAVSLENYRDHYDQNTGWLIEGSPTDLPGYFGTPEVLIPGPINPSEIDWAASLVLAHENMKTS